MKYYVVMNNKKTGIFSTMEEAKVFSKGNRNALIKSFSNEQEAKKCMQLMNRLIKNKPKNIRIISKKQSRKEKERYQKYVGYREWINKDRDAFKYSIQDEKYDYYTDKSRKRKHC